MVGFRNQRHKCILKVLANINLLFCVTSLGEYFRIFLTRNKNMNNKQGWKKNLLQIQVIYSSKTTHILREPPPLKNHKSYQNNNLSQRIGCHRRKWRIYSEWSVGLKKCKKKTNPTPGILIMASSAYVTFQRKDVRHPNFCNIHFSITFLC